MMRCAFWTATAARQSLQLSAPRLAAARSWLIRFCCTVTPSPDAACAGMAGASHTLSKDAVPEASAPAAISAAARVRHVVPTTYETWSETTSVRDVTEESSAALPG